MNNNHSVKTSGPNGAAKAKEDDVPDPFIYRLHTTRLDRLILVVMAFTLGPIKALLTVVFLALAWIPARLSVIGLPLQPDEPLSKWRVALKDVAVFLAICASHAGGLMVRKIKGRRARDDEATLLVLAPHASYLDPVVGLLCGLPGAVSVLDNAYIPGIGAIFRACQSIFLDRNDPQSRIKTADAIRRRAESKGAWPQVLIYPEGMIGNQTCILPFRLGAFQPGVPIQPVTVKYPNRLDVTTWLDSGPSLLAMISLWMCTPVTRMEVEFHPVYSPSDEEKTNPELFAQNVRSLMTQYLNIPTTELSYRDMSALVKRSKPKVGVVKLWKSILTKGYIEMPDKEHFS
ncbi:lysophospholipid acyltransferase LPCAT4-like [Watersipora subatra]|uniref:lysophospholipid acyltransferase LPCAT4-like n=1 Tax=Watersipora subatra TaxID=2589382 RepID=UPI00355C7ABC